MVTEPGLVENLRWEARRAKLALDQLVSIARSFLFLKINNAGRCWTGVGGQARVREGVLGGQYIHKQTI